MVGIQDVKYFCFIFIQRNAPAVRDHGQRHVDLNQNLDRGHGQNPDPDLNHLHRV